MTSGLYYYESAILSDFKIGGFVSLSKSAILSRFQNWLFCPTLKSAVLSHIRDLYYYESAILSHFEIGGFVSLSKSAIFSGFQNRLFCPTLKSAVLSRIHFSPNYKYFDQFLQEVINKTTVLISVFREFLPISIRALTSAFYAKRYHDFPSKLFRLTVPKNFAGEPFGVSENFR